MRVHFVSLGCPKNLVDSEVMLGALTQGGADIVPDVDGADVAVVNTCAFIEQSKKESVDAILELAKRKAEGKLGKLVVTGCLSQRYPEELAKELGEVDHFLGTGDLLKITDAVMGDGADRNLVGRPRYVPDHATPRVRATPKWTAYVKVTEGCSEKCSFCIIPQLRGAQKSRTIDDLEAEVRALVAEGVVEINLVGQNVSRYGSDLKDGTNLAGLMRRLSGVPGARWIRLHYLYPHYVTDELLEVVASAPNIVPYVDMPIQHIDDAVLTAMRRIDDGAATRRVVEAIRNRIPDVTLRTTVIVGHPGETEAGFKNLLAYVNEGWFDRLGAFGYSREDGTKAALFENQNARRTVERRRKALMEAQLEVSRQRLKARVGRHEEVLVEGVSGESDLLTQGRTRGQAPGEIDGVTYITDAPAGLLTPGRLVRAKVKRAHDHDLEAVALGAA